MIAVDERRALYRELVLAAAEREFARTGFADTKVAAIAHAADVSLATVYKTFSGKDQIWDELHRQRMTALLDLVETRMAGVASPLDRLLAGIAGAAEYLTSHGPYLELNLRTTSGWLAATGTTGAQRTVWASGIDMIAAGVEAARASGELADLRTRVATGLIISALQVWLADWVDSGRDRDSGEVITELVANLRLVLVGARPSLEWPPASVPARTGGGR